MTIAIRVLGGAIMLFGLLATTLTAEAAAPKVAGKYAMMSWHICQTVVATPKKQVSKVNAPITVPGIGGIFKSTNTFVSALTPASDTFVKSVNFTDNNTTNGSAIVSLGPTMNSAISDVGPTSTVNFVTVVQHADFPAVTAVEPIWNAGTPSGGSGMISMSVGVVTFPSTPTSSGTASATNVEVLGHSMRIADNPANNTPITRNTSSGDSTFLLTETTATLGSNVYDMTAGDIQTNGVARTINLLRRPTTNEYCIDGSTLTRQ